jgi:Transmembrane secretion effector
MNATVIQFSQGATALGGVVYGTTAQMWGVTPVLMAVAGLIVTLLLTLQLFSFPLSIDFTKELSFEPGVAACLSPDFIHVPQSRDGPVLITIDAQLDKSRGREIDALMNELRLIHLRNGAYSWELFADPTRRNHFHIEMMMPSWSQYLLQCERITKAEKQVIDRILGPQPGEIPAEIRIYIRVNKRFRARHVAWQSPNAQSMRAGPD